MGWPVDTSVTVDPFHCLVQDHHPLESVKAEHSDFGAPICPPRLWRVRKLSVPVVCPSGLRRHQRVFYSCRAPSELPHSRASWLGWGRPQGTWQCVQGPFMTVSTVEGTWLRVTGPFDTQLLVATVFRGGNGTEWCCREALCSHLVPCCP